MTNLTPNGKGRLDPTCASDGSVNRRGSNEEL